MKGVKLSPISRVSAYVLVPLLHLLICFCPLAARSQGGPPMITDDTETVPKGHWEINSAFTMERTSDGRLIGFPSADVNFGMTKHTQLAVEMPYVRSSQNGIAPLYGLGNAKIGVRWRFRDYGSNDSRH